MIRRAMLFTLVLVASSCASSDDQSETQTTSQAKRILDKASAVAERSVSKQEVMGLLVSAGLDATESAGVPVSGEMEAALPEPPRDSFALDVDGETMMAFEFGSVDAAKRMDEADDNGFRYRNWYFGPVDADLSKRMQSALQ